MAGFGPSNQLGAIICSVLSLPFPPPMEFTSLSHAMENQNETNTSPSYVFCSFSASGSIRVWKIFSGMEFFYDICWTCNKHIYSTSLNC